MQARSERHDGDVDKLYAVVEEAIRLQKGAASAVAALHAATAQLQQRSELAVRGIDTMAAGLPTRVADAVHAQLETAAETAAHRMSQSWTKANQAADRAAATYERSSEKIGREVMLYFGAGTSLGALIGVFSTYLVLR